MNRPSSPFPSKADMATVCIPLRADFRFLHEPASGRGTHSILAGRKREMDELAVRILFSNGGAFLITGYRGVGKTSFINQVVRRLVDAELWAAERVGSVRIIPIAISLPRRIEPLTLMHYLVRRLYERLRAERIFELLDPGLRSDIMVAYERTFLNTTVSATEATDLGTAQELGMLGTLKTVTVKLPFQYKRSWSKMHQRSFLGYDSQSAEYDLIGLSERIIAGYDEVGTRMARLRAWLERRRFAPRHVGIKIIYVFDELDKIDPEMVEKTSDAQSSSDPALDEVFRTLKTLFTTSGLSFVFVAGKDLHDRWLQEVGRGESVLESVFSFDKYLSCVWADVRELCNEQVDLTPLRRTAPCPDCREAFIEEEVFCPNCNAYLRDVNEARDAYRAFVKYVAYIGRGIPRRMIRCFNSYVRWIVDRPVLAFTREDSRRFAVFGELLDTLVRNEDLLIPFPAETHAADYDRIRLTVYYITDWIVSTEGEPFTHAEAVGCLESLSNKIVPVRAAERLLVKLIEILVKADFLERMHKAGESVVNQPSLHEPAAPSTSTYRITARRLSQLGNPADRFYSPSGGRRDLIVKYGDYLVEKSIGAGSMGTVFLARNAVSGERAALKVMTSTDTELRERFRREARILASVRHSNIVRFFDSGEENGEPYIAMEFIDGVSARNIIEQSAPIAKRLAFYIALRAAGALGYLHSRKMTRNDVKPSNILVGRDGRVLLVDLGITRAPYEEFGRLTTPGFILGTPNYMAPEQIQNAPADQRADIFALGIVLYELLTGAHPFEGPMPPMRIVEGSPDPFPSGLDIDSREEAVVCRCLKREPADRYQSMSELSEDLSRFAASTHEGVGAIRELIGSIDSRASASKEETKMKQATPPSAPGAFTQMFSAPQAPPAPVASGSAPPRPRSDSGEFTRFFQAAGLPLASVGPAAQKPSAGLETMGSGELTRQFFEQNATLTRLFHHEPASVDTMLSLAPSDATITVRAGPSRVGVPFPIREPRTRIGRDVENDIVLDSADVSRFHAEIIRDSEGLWIGDLGSGSGTVLNRRRLLGQAQLHDRDAIQIGGFVLEAKFSEGSASIFGVGAASAVSSSS